MRKVSIQKVIEGEKGQYKTVGKKLEGWERLKPTVKKPYIVLHKGIFRTSSVVGVQDDLIFTRNSIYRIVILGEYKDSADGLDTNTTQNILMIGIGR